MKVTVQVMIEPEDGRPAAVHEVGQFDRESLQIDTLGLQLAEARVAPTRSRRPTRRWTGCMAAWNASQANSPARCRCHRAL